MHYEYVYIDAPDSLPEVAASIGKALDRPLVPQDDGFYARLDDTATGWLRQPKRKLTAEDGSRFPFALLIRDLGGHPDDTSSTVSEATARRVYDALVAATPWRLMLAFDDGIDIVERRPALTPAA